MVMQYECFAINFEMKNFAINFETNLLMKTKIPELVFT
jgi:hypothetical protein